MKVSRFAAALAAAVCTLSAPAFASPITLGASIANNTLLSTKTYQGTFNGTSVLPANYDINSLSFSFQFIDNNDTINYGNPQNAGTTNGAYKLVDAGFSGGRDAYWYQRDVVNNKTVTATGQAESVSLALAGITVGSGATSKSTSQSSSSTTPVFGSYGARECNGNCSAFGDGYYEYFGDNVSTKTTTNLTDWTGGFQIAGTITNQDIIKQLLTTDILNFALKVDGTVYLANAQLQLDVTEKVPEPSTALLMLAALGGLGYSMRRRSAKQ